MLRLARFSANNANVSSTAAPVAVAFATDGPVAPFVSRRLANSGDPRGQPLILAMFGSAVSRRLDGSFLRLVGTGAFVGMGVRRASAHRSEKEMGSSQ